MAKSKYTPEVTEKICNAIAVYGLDEAGWTAGGIGRQSFYVWQRQHPEFSEAVRAAKSEYTRASRENLKRLGHKALLDYLEGKMVKVSHTKKEVLAPGGSIVELEEIRTSPVGIPAWAIERALGGQVTDLEAIEYLATTGLLPVWVLDCATKILEEAQQQLRILLSGHIPEPLAYQAMQEKAQSGGLSDATVAQIRAEIMGINLDRHDDAIA